jgi:hypothetical protein
MNYTRFHEKRARDTIERERERERDRERERERERERASVLPRLAMSRPAMLLLSVLALARVIFIQAQPSVLESRELLRMPRNRAHAAPPPHGSRRPSTVDCSWKYYTQPLSHFSEGSTVGGNASFSQRVCIIDTHWRQPLEASGDSSTSVQAVPAGPILFCEPASHPRVCHLYAVSLSFFMPLRAPCRQSGACRHRKRKSDR